MASFDTTLSTLNKWALIRLTIRYYANDDLSSIGGSDYQMYMPFYNKVIKAVYRNSTALSEVTTLSANDQYKVDGYYLTCRLASAPSSSNVVTVLFNEYYTNGEGKVFVDPDTSDIVNYAPKIVSFPESNQSIENFLSGVMTIGDTSFEILDLDYGFRNYLNQNYNFRNEECKVWFGAGDISSSQSAEIGYLKCVYSGFVRSYQLGNQSIRISIYDKTTGFKEPAYFGDTSLEVLPRKTASSYPNMRKEDEGRSIPYIIGKYSYNTLEHVLSEPFTYNVKTGNEAFCSNYNSTLAVGNNLEWVLCRVDALGLKTQAIASIIQAGYAGSKLWIQVSGSTLDNFMIGSPFKYNDGSGVQYGYVAAIGDFTISSNTYNMYINGIIPSVPVNAGYFIPTDNICIRFWDADTDTYYDITPAMYTVSNTATSGGNRLLKVTFNTSYAPFNTIEVDPATDKVYYKVMPQSTLAIGYLDNAIRAAGLVEPSSGYGGTMDATVVFDQVPDRDSSEISDYATVIQRILYPYGKAIIYDPVTARTKVASLQTGGGTTFTESDILQNSLTIEYDYNDIVFDIDINNLLNVNENEDLDDTGSVTAYYSSNRVRYLYNTLSTKAIDHVYQFAAINDQLKYSLFNPKVIYRFKIFSKAITFKVGDLATISHSKLPSPEDVFIVGVLHTIDHTEITAIKAFSDG